MKPTKSKAATGSPDSNGKEVADQDQSAQKPSPWFWRRRTIIFLAVTIPVLVAVMIIVFGSILMPDWATSRWLFKLEYKSVYDRDGFLAGYNSQLKGTNHGRIPAGMADFLIGRLRTTQDPREKRAVLTFFALRDYDGLAERNGVVESALMETPPNDLDVLLTSEALRELQFLPARLLLVEEVRCGRSLSGFRLTSPVGGGGAVAGAAYAAYFSWYAKLSHGTDWSELRKIDPLDGTGISWQLPTPTKTP